MAGSNPPFMNGVPELLVLQLLDHHEMYGYQLVKSIRSATGESISPGEGVVYPILHSLEKTGALKSRSKTVNGRTRVYYTVRPKGRRRLAELVERWGRIENGIDSALDHAIALGNRDSSTGVNFV